MLTNIEPAKPCLVFQEEVALVDKILADGGIVDEWSDSRWEIFKELYFRMRWADMNTLGGLMFMVSGWGVRCLECGGDVVRFAAMKGPKVLNIRIHRHDPIEIENPRKLGSDGKWWK